MSISLDASSSRQEPSGSTNWSWTHTPVSATDAVLVLLANDSIGSYTITGVDYGGVVLNLVARLSALDVLQDRPTVYCYFKSGGLPAGAQTVAVTDSSNTNKLGGCFGIRALNVLGNPGAEVQTYTARDFGNTGVDNPQVAVSCQSSRDAFIAGVLGSGDNTATATDNGDQTRLDQFDFGTRSAYISQKTAIHSGTTTAFGYTQESFQHMLIAAAVSEIGVQGNAVVNLGSMAGRGSA